MATFCHSQIADCGVISRWLFKRRARHRDAVREQELQVSSLFCVTCHQPTPFPSDCLLVTIDVSAFYLNIPQDTMALETPRRDTVREQELKCRRHGLRDPAEVSYGYECSHRHPRAGRNCTLVLFFALPASFPAGSPLALTKSTSSSGRGESLGTKLTSPLVCMTSALSLELFIVFFLFCHFVVSFANLKCTRLKKRM